jgi:hypothetical protein
MLMRTHSGTATHSVAFVSCTPMTERLMELVVEWLATGSRSGRAARLERPYKSIVLPRFIALDGVTNCRDLGGYPTADGMVVRPRRLFRAGEYVHVAGMPSAEGGVADLYLSRSLLCVPVYVCGRCASLSPSSSLSVSLCAGRWGSEWPR